MLLQILFSGLIVGSCYSIVSVGMTILIQGTTVLNFAHGECVMIGAFVFLTLVTAGISYPLAALLSIIICMIIGALMDKMVFKRLLNAPHVNVVLATCGFLYLFKGIARKIWTSEHQFPPPLFDIPSIKLPNVVVCSQDIAILATVLILTAFFVWVFFFTNLGLKMRAASQNLKGARLIGINTDLFYTSLWAVSLGAGAIAGILLGPIYSVFPDMGESFLIRAFAAMTLGGFGNIGGAAIGGLLMGILENLAGFYIWTPLKEIVAYLVIVLVLLIRPTGILGARKF